RLDHITHVCIPSWMPERVDKRRLACARVVRHIHYGSYLQHKCFPSRSFGYAVAVAPGTSAILSICSALCRIFTSFHRLSLLNGRVSSIATLSPTPASFLSS